MSMTANDRIGYCKKVEETEAYYWETDGILLDVIDKIIVRSDSDDDNSFTIISSDSDDNTDRSECDSDCNKEEETDEELARPLYNVSNLSRFKV